MIKEIFLTTLTGALLGSIFAILRLPVPAPPVFSGLMGIFGIWLGYTIILKFVI
jgi:XapX domain-containing protein